MISLKKLIQFAKSPDRALQQSWNESEATLARLAHVNRLSRDIMDIKFYEVDLSGGNTGFINISSKKGIVDIINYSNSNDIYISLQNPEITQEREKFYVQLTAYGTGDAIPLIYGIGFIPNSFNLRITDIAETGGDWGALYFYYELVKID